MAVAAAMLTTAVLALGSIALTAGWMIATSRGARALMVQGSGGLQLTLPRSPVGMLAMAPSSGTPTPVIDTGALEAAARARAALAAALADPPTGSITADAETPLPLGRFVPLPRQQAEASPPPAPHAAPDIAAAIGAPVMAPPAKPHVRVAETRSDSMLQGDADEHTAIYDIAAHAVYLPNGNRLEAHSGLGSRIDNPRFVNVKNQGPTPPNTYRLVLRQPLFHGVQAIRLLPVGGGNMYGRDGILAHSYMLGPNGQSNGCVSFSNYPAFLHAFLRNEVDRMVVVTHLAGGPPTAARWRRGRTDQVAFNNQ